VKYVYIFLALLGIVFASHAQQPASENSEGKNFEKFKAQQVPSPNRTSSKDWARSLKPNKSGEHKGDKVSSTPAAVVWVDSTGKTVGRALEIGSFFGDVLVTFENELIVLQGLFPERRCDFNGDFCTLTFSGGVSWIFSSLQYPSTDCTGTPYISSATTGRPINGVAIIDNGETFIYLYNVTQNTVQTIQSFFSNGRCSQSLGGSFPQNVSPVMAVVPASTFGITPFFLK
jgi:hypothetical protein